MAKSADDPKNSNDPEKIVAQNRATYDKSLSNPRWERIHPEQRDDMATFQSAGHLLYWASVAIAAFAVLVAVVIFMNPAQDNTFGAMLLLVAVVIWLTGRGLRYLMSGR